MNEVAQQHQAAAAGVATFDDVDSLQPGARFTVTWAFRNVGTAVWQPSDQLAFTDERQPDATAYPHTNLAAQPAFALADLGTTNPIPPDASAYFTLTFTAPSAPGTYLTGWQLQTAVGARFGPVRELRIVVVPPSKALTDYAYEVVDFANSEPNYNAMSPQRPFSGTWTLKNSGTAVWSGGFRVQHVVTQTADTADAQSNLMGANSSATLQALSGKDAVAPGDTITIQLRFTSPAQPGIYAYHWQIMDETGRPFGGTRWLRIVVKPQETATPTPPPVATSQYKYGGTAVAFFSGIHGPADDYMWHDKNFQRMMQRLNMPVFFWSQGANGDYAHFGNPTQNAVRLYWNPEAVSADKAYAYVRDDQLRPWWHRGYRRFIFFNEPQFGYEIAKIEEGFGIAWHNKEQFAKFLAHCLSRARADFPGIQLFTTPMSSNEAFDPWGWRNAMWQQVKGLVDGWCMHAYTGDNVNANTAATDIAKQVVELQRRFQLQIPIIISEASVNRGGDATQKAQVAHLLHQKLAQVPGIHGVFWYAADWNPDYDQHKEGWFRNGIADAYIEQRDK